MARENLAPGTPPCPMAPRLGHISSPRLEARRQPTALPPPLAPQVDKHKRSLLSKKKELMEGKTALSLCCHQGLPFPQLNVRHEP